MFVSLVIYTKVYLFCKIHKYMAREIKKKGKKYFQCPVCSFYYKTNDLAQKCENFCKKHNSCSLEITKHAVEIK